MNPNVPRLQHPVPLVSGLPQDLSHLPLGAAVAVVVDQNLAEIQLRSKDLVLAKGGLSYLFG